MSTTSTLARLALALALLVVAAFPGTGRADPEYLNSGERLCLDCHGNSRVLGITKTAHADRTNPDTPLASQKACESCHGPSKTHSQFPMQVENIHFGKRSNVPAKVQNQACLECHEKKKQHDWKVSAHGFEHLVCSTCHSIHDPKRIVPSQTRVVDGCTAAGCHPAFRPGTSHGTFTHAVGRPLGDDGMLTCASCHDPHGPLSSARCLECHVLTPDVVAKQSEKAQHFHKVAEERGTECIRCHKALAHPIKSLEEHLKQEASRAERAGSATAGE